MRCLWTLSALVAVALAITLGCSSSTNSSGVCCTVAMGGQALCLCGTESVSGITCTSSGTGSGCAIRCTQGGTTQSITGAASATCDTASFDAGNTNCGYTGAACCSTGTACQNGCCDPTTQVCVFDGEQCSGGASICSSSSCQPCGGTGQPCCLGQQCTGGGCCDDQATTNTCVAKGAACGMPSSNRVCTSQGYCESCGTDGLPCCAGNVCTGTSVVCATVGSSQSCTSCGITGEPCCTQGTPCTSGTCNGMTCQ